MTYSELDPTETSEATGDTEKARRFANEVNRTIEEHRQNDSRAAESDEKLGSLLEFQPDTKDTFEYDWDTTEDREVVIADEVVSLKDFVTFVDNEIGEMPTQGWKPDEVKDALQGRDLQDLEEKYGLVKIKKGLEETLKAVDKGQGQLQDRLAVESTVFGSAYAAGDDRRAGEVLTQDTGANNLLQEDHAMDLVRRNRGDILDRIESYEHRITAQVQHADNALAVYGQEVKDSYEQAMSELQGQLEQLAAFGEVYENSGNHSYEIVEGGEEREQLHKERAEHEMHKRIQNIGDIMHEATKMTEEYVEAVNVVQENAKHTREEFSPKSLEILEDMRESYEATLTRTVGGECQHYDSIETYVNDLTGGAYDSVGNGLQSLEAQIAGRLESGEVE